MFILFVLLQEHIINDFYNENKYLWHNIETRF